MSRPKGSRNKVIGIAPFEVTHEANILRETVGGGFVTSEFVSIKKAEDSFYRVTLTLKNGEMHEAEGATLYEAMSKIQVKDIIKTLGTIIATYKGKKVERVCNASRLQRIFGVGSKQKETARIIYSKFMSSGL